MQAGVNEEALMEAYVAGDPGAFQRLFRALAPSLHAFFARTVGDGSAAEDLLQTTFLKLHGARGSWRRGERLRPWVFTIAARVRVDWLRRNGRRGQEEELDGDVLADPEAPGDPGEAVLGKQRAERVPGCARPPAPSPSAWSFTCTASRGSGSRRSARSSGSPRARPS